MNLLPLSNPEYIDILTDIGAVVAAYQRGDASQTQARLTTLNAKPLSAQAADVVKAIVSLMSRKYPLTQETLVQDIQTEMHYMKLLAGKEEANKKDLAFQQDRLKTFQDQLKAL
jgi:hypothetical protein